MVSVVAVDSREWHATVRFIAETKTARTPALNNTDEYKLKEELVSHGAVVRLLCFLFIIAGPLLFISVML